MFKVPSNIPQDLLLIHDLVSGPVPGPSGLKARPREHPDDSSDSSSSESESTESSSNSDSSDSESDSDEAKIVERLLTDIDVSGQGGGGGVRSLSQSSSESSSSDSDTSSESDSNEDLIKGIEKQALGDFEEDEDGDGHVSSGALLRTKNEVSDPSVVTPDIAEIDAQEPLEKVGEIMSIIENVVVVKGIGSGIENRASMRALDSESLLVFEDRKVLGYVYETFGPTHQPLYQVKFPSAGSIDRDVVKISREVFHVPPRSHFVFPSQLAKVKGSDASNVHDEEVDEDEIEFSDDEAEAAYRQRRKRKRDGYRESSVASSRFSTPTPSQMRDQEVNDGAFYGASAYDEYGPYDVGIASGPSRPAPLPYDDPYQDAIPSSGSFEPSGRSLEDGPSSPRGPRNFHHDSPRDHGHGRGRGRDRGRGRGRGQGPGRGGFDHRGMNGQRTSRRASFERRDRRPSLSRGRSSSASVPRSLSPTSMAIARATGQYTDGSAFPLEEVPPSPSSPSRFWQQQNFSHGSFNDTSQQSFGALHPQHSSQQPYPQPHINPRFASLFGIDMNYVQDQQYGPFGVSPSSLPSPYSPHSPNTLWANSTWTPNTAAGTGQSQHPDEYVVQTKTENDEYRP